MAVRFETKDKDPLRPWGLFGAREARMSMPNEATPAFWQLIEQQADVNSAMDELTLKVLETQRTVNMHHRHLGNLHLLLDSLLKSMDSIQQRHYLLAKEVYGTDSRRD